MRILLPNLPETDRTRPVQKLLDIIHLQQGRIQQPQEGVHPFVNEIARLKGLWPRLQIGEFRAGLHNAEAPRASVRAVATPPRSRLDVFYRPSREVAPY
jgi:hypothetical protein